MNKKLSLLTIILLSGGIGFYTVQHWDRFVSLFGQMRFLYLPSLFALVFLMTGVNGYITKLFLRRFNVEIGVREWFSVSVLNALGNYLTPFRGGMAFKGVYLKKRFSFSYSSFAATLAASYLLLFLSGGILALLLLGLLYLRSGVFQSRLFLFFALLSLLLLLPLFLPVSIRSGNPLIGKIKSVFDGWNIIRNDRHLIAALLLLLLLNYIFISFMYYFGFKTLGSDIGFIRAAVMGIITGYASVISITPGNLGLQEAVAGFTAQIMGSDFTHGLAVAAIIRIAQMAYLFTAGPLCALLLMRRQEDQHDNNSPAVLSRMPKKRE